MERNSRQLQVDWTSMGAYLQIILFSLPAIAGLGILVWIMAISALLHLYEGFLILICQGHPTLQLGIELELGTVRLLYRDVLVIRPGPRYAMVSVEECWVCWEGKDLRNG